MQGADAEQLRMQIDDLERQLAARNRALFGDKSERRPQGEPDRPAPKPPQKGHGPRPQPQLAMLAVLREMDAADRVCKACGSHLEPWSGQYELPLERQVRIMRRERLAVDSQTLWNPIERLARPLCGVPEPIRQYVLSHDVVFADETRRRLMRGKRGPPVEKNGPSAGGR